MSVQKKDRYDFIVTGASGNVGRHLIPILARRGFRILAVGRNAAALRDIFADFAGEVNICRYDELGSPLKCDTLIQLAVRNNNNPGSLDEFIEVNVGFAEEVAQKFIEMEGNRFICMSSILSLDEKNHSPYAVSKEIGRQRLTEILNKKLDNIYIGYFYADNYFGEKLSFLNFTGFAAPILLSLFKTLKPSTSSNSLANYIMGPAATGSHPLIITEDVSRLFFYRMITRTMDIAVSIAVLTLLAPLLAILFVAIRLDSPGPAIFAQQRVGALRRPFTLYKFRTMNLGTRSAGTHEVNSDAVTKIGKFLRRTKIDELPQAINLFRGDMTLVGPRPCLSSQEELVDARQALGVYTLKPGITGYSQVREIDMSRPQHLAVSDYMYKKLLSLSLNLKIILLTAFGSGGGDRVNPATKESS